MSHEPEVLGPHGIMAEFSSATELVQAARAARKAGYVKMDAYSPFPIEELTEALEIKHTILPMLVLGAGISGCIGGFAMQYFASVIHYPVNIGGRPLNSWPMFIPITFEVTILLSALTAVFGMLALNGFPSPYHPAFNVPRFERASQDGFFLCIEAEDAKFDLVKTMDFLKTLNPREVNVVDA